ncbi:MAG: type II toxin-antitoxin system death-on-curing family toxin [Bacteroidetes bacterium]|nr:type II toxin-antitoxin system death-on-curing family toxin [Bacteroidota bacterium]
MKIKYLSEQDIIELNVVALSLIKIKKADKSELLSYYKLKAIVEGCKKLKGDIYDKTAFLLKEIIKQHAFASGNRRTAFIAAKHFLTLNNAIFNIKDEPEYAKIMTGIRENYYSDEEIKNWIQNGQIREFKRR